MYTLKKYHHYRNNNNRSGTDVIPIEDREVDILIFSQYKDVTNEIDLTKVF